MKKLDGRAHIEIARSEQNCLDYACKADTRIGEVVQLGEKPYRRNCKQDWDEIWSMAKSGNLEAIPADIRIKHYRTLKEIAKDNLVM